MARRWALSGSAWAERWRFSRRQAAEPVGGRRYYGLPPEEAAKPAELAIPLMGHFRHRDDWCSPAVVANSKAD